MEMNMDWMTISEWARPLWVVWLVVLFVGIVTWAFWPGNKSRFEDDAQIVFKDEKNGG